MRTFKHLTKCLLLGAALAVGILGGGTVQAQPAVEAWVRGYDGSATLAVPGGAAQKMVVDSSGNVIVTGFNYSPGFLPNEGLIIQYSATGALLWTNLGPSVTAVAVDGSGNVFVAGGGATIKYSNAGIPLWTNYGGDGALAADGNGNLIVTRNSYDTNGFFSGSETTKYTGAGLPLWTNLGPDGGVAAVAVDGSGNVFVAGSSGVDGGNVFTTIKYSAGGVPLWTNLGPREGVPPYSYASALAMDGNGNVIVTGRAANAQGDYDYVTIKYSGVGVPLWTNRYDGGFDGYPAAVAVDGNDNVIVMGDEPDTNGYLSHVTIKYSGVGVPLWTNRHEAGLGGYAIAVAVDSSGNVVVAGSSATIKYSDAGTPLWTNYVGATAMAVDGDGDVFVTGNEATTIAYSSAGVPLWTNCYVKYFRGDDHAKSVAVDGNGNVFVTGYSYGTDGTACATIKYSDAGVTLWETRSPMEGVKALALDGSDNVVVAATSVTIKYSDAGIPLWTNHGSASALGVDGTGNVFVTGSSYVTSGTAFVTSKYSEAGVPLWTNLGPSGGASALAVDSSGNVVVTGSLFAPDRVRVDLATIKYSAAGAPLWTNRYNGAENGQDYVAGPVAVDTSGNVFVAGRGAAIIAYSSAGVPLWTNRYRGNDYDNATALAVDSSGNVVVTGHSYSNTYDYVTIKYSGAGVPLWTNRYHDGQANAVAVDRSGGVFVTGSVTVKYSGAGVPLWTNSFNGGYANALAVDDSGNVVVTGYSIGSDGSSDFLTIKYSPAGLPLLTIARTITNTVAVSWPSPSTGFTLQQNTDPSTTNWSPVGTTPSDDGTTKTVLVNSPVGNRFYRLVHP